VQSVNGVNQHNYVAFFEGLYWVMWSDGPGIEDRVGQRVKFATSVDALNWAPGGYITPIAVNSGPDSQVYNTNSSSGLRWIARGFWVRNNQLIALASLDEAGAYFGPSLTLHGFVWDNIGQSWTSFGVIAGDTITNHPPMMLPSGEWMMSRRAQDYTRTGISFLIGGVTAPDSWESILAFSPMPGWAAEEPFWWILPDSGLIGLFRDNKRSGFLYRAFSRDIGRHWEVPQRTNFPDATSKSHGIRLADGRYILVSNPDPERRDPLVLSISDDGVTFHSMGYLVGGRWVDYPHVMQVGDSVVVAFSGAKQTVEVLKFPVSELDLILNQYPGADVIAYYDFSPANQMRSGVPMPELTSSNVSLKSLVTQSGAFARSTKNNDVFFRSDAVGSATQSAGIFEFSITGKDAPLAVTSVEFDYAFTGAGAFASNRGSFVLQIDSGLGWQDAGPPLNLNVHSEGIAHGGFNWSTQYGIDHLDTGSAKTVRFRILLFDELNVTNEWMRLDNIKVYGASSPPNRMRVAGVSGGPGAEVRIVVEGLDVRWCRYQLRRSANLDGPFSEVVDGPRHASSYQDTFIDRHPLDGRGFYIVEQIVDDN
jgi:hypothetical protein